MRKQYVVDLVAKMTNIPYGVAESVVDRLQEEGLLHLGYGDADVDKIVDKFKDTFGTTKTTKQDRWAAHRLSEKYGSQSIAGIIQLLGENSQQKFCPVANSVAELESKLPSILNFLRNIKGEGVIEI